MMVLIFLVVGVGFGLVGEYTGTPEQRESYQAARQHQIEVSDEDREMYGR